VVTNKSWSIVFGVVLAACFLLFVVAAIVPWWLPRQISTFGDSVDHLFYLILAITAFFFVLTEGMLVYNIWEFGKPERTAKAPYVHGNHKLETIWTIVPAVILILISIVQIGTWEKIKYTSTFPKESPETCQMVVVARQWEWRVRYPNPEEIRSWESEAAKSPEKKSKGAETWGRFADYPYEDLPQFDDVHDVNAVHCWVNGKVLVHLKTRDVLHSFFLPQARLKQDAVPGKVIQVWFEPIDYNVEPKGGKWAWRQDAGGSTKPFEWELACAEFCGARHSLMRGQLFVHKDRADFMKWLEYHKAEQQKHQAKPIAAQ
jgi:cytochrome c oxidase subunit II